MKKRSRLEDLVNKGETAFVDRPLAMVFLKAVDAQDAMSFAAKMGMSERFYSIVEALREDEIWLYWFKRDLDVFGSTPEAFLPWIPPENTEYERPEWKTTYLWYRLLITGCQWIILERYRDRIMNAYPPGTELRVLALNVLEMSRPGHATELLDYRVEFQRIVRELPRYNPRNDLVPGFTFYSLAVFVGIEWVNEYLDHMYGNSNYTAFLTSMYPDMVLEHKKSVAMLLASLYTFEFRDAVHRMSLDEDTRDILNLARIRFGKTSIMKIPRGSQNDRHLYLLLRQPRLVRETHLLVASPLQCISASCTADATLCERQTPEHAFCSYDCQRSFYRNP